MSKKTITIIKLKPFLQSIKKIFTHDDLKELEEFLVAFPAHGDVIPGTGGLRKLRWAAKGKGKRGGARVIYFYYVNKDNVYLLAAYTKNDKTDLSSNEKQAFKKMIEFLVKGEQ